MSYRLDFVDNLPMVSMRLSFQGQHTVIDRVLVDTGSAGTIFSSDQLFDAGMSLEQKVSIVKIMGVGGSEMVARTSVDALALGSIQCEDFPIQVGMMDYGFVLNGILGMDFLRGVGAVIDLEQGTIRSSR